MSEIRPLLLLLQMPNCYCFRCSVVSIASLPFPLLPCFHTSRLPWILWIPGSYILSIGEPARPPDCLKSSFSALLHAYCMHTACMPCHCICARMSKRRKYNQPNTIHDHQIRRLPTRIDEYELRFPVLRLRFLIPLFSHNSTQKASLRALPTLQLCRILRRFLIRCQKKSGSRKTFVQP